MGDRESWLCIAGLFGRPGEALYRLKLHGIVLLVRMLKLKRFSTAISGGCHCAGLLVLGCWTAFGGGDYYESFCAARGVDVSRNKRVDAPALLDTNNTAFRITNILTGLTESRKSGEVASLRLGMTMDEVVAAWGKPPQFIWTWCFGGPRLCYADASAIFDPATNRLIRVRLEVVPHHEDAPSPSITIDDAIQLLGPPTARTEDELIYAKEHETLRLHFPFGRRLLCVNIERTKKK